jgi:hypothetical protein
MLYYVDEHKPQRVNKLSYSGLQKIATFSP